MRPSFEDERMRDDLLDTRVEVAVLFAGLIARAIVFALVAAIIRGAIDHHRDVLTVLVDTEHVAAMGMAVGEASRGLLGASGGVVDLELILASHTPSITESAQAQGHRVSKERRTAHHRERGSPSTQ